MARILLSARAGGNPTVEHHANNGHTQLPITRLSDETWEYVRPVLEQYDPPRRLGRKRIDQRGALDAIVYRIRSGCRWNHLPKEYPDDSSVHRTYQRWQRLGVLDRVLDMLGENGRERTRLNGVEHARLN
jgi:transposase